MIRIGAVSMVKNESDIIELFLKVNLRSLDKIFLIDHCSEDGTPEIIKAMQCKHPQIELLQYSSEEFNQSNVITTVVRNIASHNILDFIIPLDADEFISENNQSEFRKIIASTISKNEAALIPWETYCPISMDYFISDSPLYSCFRKRSKEPRQFYKVILGNEYAKECIVSEGNHSAFSSKYDSASKIIRSKIKHVPVRNSDQIIRKALMGSYSLSLKRGRKSSEGYHWDEIANIVRNNNYKLGIEQLSDIALYYAATRDCDVNIDFNSSGIGLPEDKITLIEMAKPSIMKSYDILTLNLINKIRESWPKN